MKFKFLNFKILAFVIFILSFLFVNFVFAQLYPWEPIPIPTEPIPSPGAPYPIGQPLPPEQAPAAQPGYNLPPLPTGSGYTQGEIQGILIKFANFLIAAGVVLGIITIVVSGIMYFRAGSDTKAESAKGWFRNGITGAFIILAVGVIILTIYNIVVNRSFFGGPTIPGVPPGSGQPSSGGVGGGGVAGGGPGAACSISAGCVLDTTYCAEDTKICRRSGGNLLGEGCKVDFDCATGLKCKGGIFGIGQKTCEQP